MKDKILNTVLVVGSSLASVMTSVANAGLIINDSSDGFVTDTVTDFNWLDMSYNANKSFNDVSGLLFRDKIVDSLGDGSGQVGAESGVLVMLMHQSYIGVDNYGFTVDEPIVSRNLIKYFSLVELKSWLTPTIQLTAHGNTQSMVRRYTSDIGAVNSKNYGHHVTIQFGGNSVHEPKGRSYPVVDSFGRVESQAKGYWNTF